MINYKGMNYDEMHEVYMDLLDELSFIRLLMKLKKQEEEGNRVSAELLTEKLIRDCREFND